MTRTAATLSALFVSIASLTGCPFRQDPEPPRCAPSEVEPTDWNKFAAGELRNDLVGEWTGVLWRGPWSENVTLSVSAPTADPTFHYDPAGCASSDFVQFALPVSISLSGQAAPREALAEVRANGDGYATLMVGENGTPCGEGCVLLDAPYRRELRSYLPEASLTFDGVYWHGRMHRCGAETLSVADWTTADGEWTAREGLTPSAERNALVGSWKPDPNSSWPALAPRVAAEVGPAPGAVTRVAYANRGERPDCVDAFRFSIPVTVYLVRGPLTFDAVVESFPALGTWEAAGLVTEDDPYGGGTRTARVTLTFVYGGRLHFSFDWDQGEAEGVSVLRQ